MLTSHCGDPAVLARKRQELLARPHWLGLGRLRPLQTSFSRERAQVGRRREITEDDLRRQGKRRPGYAGKHRVSAPAAVISSPPLPGKIRPDDVSVRFGTQALLDVQLSPEEQVQQTHRELQLQHEAATSSQQTSSSRLPTSPSPRFVGEPLHPRPKEHQKTCSSRFPRAARIYNDHQVGDDELYDDPSNPPEALIGAMIALSHRVRSDDMLFSSLSSKRVKGTADGTTSHSAVSDEPPFSYNSDRLQQDLGEDRDDTTDLLRSEPPETSATDSETWLQRRTVIEELRAAANAEAGSRDMPFESLSEEGSTQPAEQMADPRAEEHDLAARGQKIESWPIDKDGPSSPVIQNNARTLEDGDFDMLNEHNEIFAEVLHETDQTGVRSQSRNTENVFSKDRQNQQQMGHLGCYSKSPAVAPREPHRYTFKKPPRFSRGQDASETVLQLGTARSGGARRASQRAIEQWNIHAEQEEVRERQSGAEDGLAVSETNDEDDIEDY